MLPRLSKAITVIQERSGASSPSPSAASRAALSPSRATGGTTEPPPSPVAGAALTAGSRWAAGGLPVGSRLPVPPPAAGERRREGFDGEPPGGVRAAGSREALCVLLLRAAGAGPADKPLPSSRSLCSERGVSAGDASE